VLNILCICWLRVVNRQYHILLYVLELVPQDVHRRPKPVGENTLSLQIFYTYKYYVPNLNLSQSTKWMTSNYQVTDFADAVINVGTACSIIISYQTELWRALHSAAPRVSLYNIVLSVCMAVTPPPPPPPPPPISPPGLLPHPPNKHCSHPA